MFRPLAAFADIVVGMAIARGLGETRRRTFTSISRYPGALKNLTAELSLAGTDYLVTNDKPPVPLLSTLKALLAESPTPLSRSELLARWPGPPPGEASLWRTLQRGCETGLFTCRGPGIKSDPHRYELAAKSQPPEGTDVTPTLPSGNALPPSPPSPAGPEPIAPTTPRPATTPEPVPAPPAVPPLTLKLPFPYCAMNPANVPEAVWQAARVQALRDTQKERARGGKG